MTPEQLVEELRKRGYHLEIAFRYSREGSTTYTARFWWPGRAEVPPIEHADTFAEVVHLAVMTISKRDNLNLPSEYEAAGLRAAEKASEFVVWAYGILWGMGIMAGLLILAEALR